ncbi:DUF2169 family type VI secretion system accessory protein [Chondromyces apiculatus]|nr:DUF2169 domain-containing protein [Chondromyces apiculatus]
MSFANATPYMALDVPMQDHEGREFVVAIVKASFAVTASGKLAPAEPVSIRLNDALWYPDAIESSLKLPSDLCIEKQGTDVVVVGHAISAHPVEVMDVAVKVGGVVVPLRVHGQRMFYRSMMGVSIGPAAPFERMPVVYERAWGGASDDLWIVESRNPAGRGVARKPKDLVDTPAPQIEHPALPHTSADDEHPPVGFGAIRSHWSPRKEYVGTFDEVWERTRSPMLPADFDVRFNNVAHPSLRFEAPLLAGEAIAVLGMSPEGLVQFEIPEIAVRIVGRSDLSGRVEARPTVDTVLILPEEGRVELTLRKAFRLGRGRDVLRELRVEQA